MLPLTKKCYENIFECSIRIQKLYDKLYDLDINGKRNNDEYKQIVEYIKTLKHFENHQYDKLFSDFQSFLEFNDYYIKKFYELLESYDSIDLIYDKRDLMPFQRIDVMFNRRLAVSDNYDKIMELNTEPEVSIEAEDESIVDGICQLIEKITKPLYSQDDDKITFETTPNYLMFNMFVDSKFYKNTMRLLRKKLNNYSHTDSNYKMLIKYYYGLIYMQESIEDMFLNNKKEKTNVFPKFIENLPNSDVKTSYLKILDESNCLLIICILRGIILREFPDLNLYSDDVVEELYYIQLENLISLTPNEIKESLELAITKTIDCIFQSNNEVTVEKEEVIQKTKKIINKVKRNDI